MKKYRVLHVSPTPLVDAPRKISDSINSYTEYISDSFVFNDYPGKLKNLFSFNTLLFNKSKKLILELIKNADIIHIHNFLTLEQEQIILKYSKSDVLFVYQVHSPLREGPIFSEYAEDGKIHFDSKCVVAQYQPRLYKNYKIVPNIILQEPSKNLIQENEKPKILFSPAHTRTGGRWNDKTIPKVDELLKSLSALEQIELINTETYTPHELYQLRKRCHISIDEIVTGAYHQISLEGLCSGNVVINNSDVFSDLMLKFIIHSNQEIPFYKVNIHNITEKLYTLISDKDLIRKYQNSSYEFYIKNLTPNKLVNHYKDLYDEII